MSVSECLAGLTRLTAGANSSPEVVVYESRGCVLVLGDDASVGDVAKRLARDHVTVVFAPGIDAQNLGPRVTAVGRRVTQLRGHLGAFQAEIYTGDDLTDIGVASPNANRCFDLVLDLCEPPLLVQEVKPFGYFAPGIEAVDLQAAMDAMRNLVGHFSKPRYFKYETELCAHGSSGLAGCNRCLNVCSAEAITSTGNAVRVDPYLCQGCASCALSCPTGALAFKSPDRQTLGDRLQEVLQHAPVGAPLVVHSAAFDAQTLAELSHQGAVMMQVEPLAAFGDELWLRVLALGADALVLVNDASLPEKTRILISERVDQVEAVLSALGVPTGRLAWLAPGQLHDWLANNAVKQKRAAPILPAVASLKSWVKFKRLAWVDGLRQMGADLAQAPVELPVGASMGEVLVDTQRCTLCFACVNLCPTRALVARHEATQQLVFQESACVQCGLCVRACPEKAVSLHARFTPQVFAQMTSKVLHQDEQFKCTSCGTPFINRRLLASSLERLKDHPVMAQGGREALMTCPSCRQREMIEI